MAKLGLSSPWVIFYREIEALFAKDPEVRVIYDEESNTVRLYVENSVKADALAALLPVEKTFGNVTLFINVIPANGQENISASTDFFFEKAFAKNPILSYIKRVSGIFKNDITYIVFKNEVVQYFNDSLADVNGMCSTLYQDIAKNVFGETEGIFFCTDIKTIQVIDARNNMLDNDGSFGRPLGEWP